MPVGYTIIRVLLPVSRCVYHPCRPCIWRFPYFRAINIHGIVNNPTAAVWPVNISNVINTHITVVGNPPDLVNSWAGYISAVVINVGVVNDSSTMNNIYHAGLRHIIVIDVWPVDISLRRAHPVIIRYAIAVAERYTDADTRL